MFGETIKKLREKKGLTQLELSFLIHEKYKTTVVTNTISRWETNHTIPRSKHLKMISEIFEVDINDLLNILGKKPKTEGKPKDNNIIRVGLTLEDGKKVNYEVTVSKIKKISEIEGTGIILEGGEENGKY